jgi:hypothetical protein
MLWLWMAACGGDTTMSTEGYDQSCEIADTCRAVFVGDVCGCPCEVDAISYTQETLWAQERSRKADRCDEILDCAACPSIDVSCNSGTCEARVASDDTDGDSDT